MGEPKSSAYEHYLRPTSQGNLQVPGWLTETVFDKKSHTKSSIRPLAGRKHYLHYPPTATELDKRTGEQAKQNSTLQAFLTCPQQLVENQEHQYFPRFQFTVRFNKLEVYEVGLLLFVLNLSDGVDSGEVAQCLANKNYQSLEQKQILALKMGYARPLGFGSMLSQIDPASFCVRSANSQQTPSLQKAQDFLDQFKERFGSWFDKAGTEIWDQAKHLKDLQTLLRFQVHQDYPDLEFSYPRKGDPKEIFQYHMDLHKEVIPALFKHPPTAISAPLPPAQEVWKKTIECFQETPNPRENQPSPAKSSQSSKPRREPKIETSQKTKSGQTSKNKKKPKPVTPQTLVSQKKLKGRVKYFNGKKGAIARDKGNDVEFRKKDLAGMVLNANDTVEFEIRDEFTAHPSAVNIKKL